MSLQDNNYINDPVITLLRPCYDPVGILFMYKHCASILSEGLNLVLIMASNLQTQAL
jgi:hypothetical protein